MKNNVIILYKKILYYIILFHKTGEYYEFS